MMATSSVERMTALLLAGGQGARMGGVDKGLQTLGGKALAVHVATRIAPQAKALIISANRHLEAYAELGAPFDARVIHDKTADFAGPLAGILAGLQAAQTELVLCVPCDAPCLPLDLGKRLYASLDAARADIATALTFDKQGHASLQPVFALLKTSLADDLAAFFASGNRTIRTWYARHTTVEVPFTHEDAFYNVNSLQALAKLEHI